MKNLILFGLLLLSFQTSFGQLLFAEKYKGCDLNIFCIDCGEPKAEPPANAANEIYKNLNISPADKLEGRIWVQIFVDTFGTPCLASSENFTNISSRNLKHAINSMSKWTPAKTYGIPRIVSVSLELVFKNGKFGMRRLENVTSTNDF